MCVFKGADRNGLLDVSSMLASDGEICNGSGQFTGYLSNCDTFIGFFYLTFPWIHRKIGEVISR